MMSQSDMISWQGKTKRQRSWVYCFHSNLLRRAKRRYAPPPTPEKQSPGFLRGWETSVLKIPWLSKSTWLSTDEEVRGCADVKPTTLAPLSHRWEASRHHLIYPD